MQRCHRASGRYSAALSIRPRQASEMMSCTPLRPRSTRWRRNADQPDLSSLAPSQMPRISRNPSELTALATSRETLRTSPAQLRFITRLFDRPAHHLAKMIADPSLVDLDDLPHRLLGVEDITEALWGTRVSPSTVSNLNKK